MIYPPQEDSFLMQEALKRVIKKGTKVLEVGTGTGILAFEASKIARHIDAVDINPDALNFVKEQIKALNFNNINVFQSNLFDNIAGKYDLIVFNPPYLPEDKIPTEKWLKDATIGGKQGNEIINKFIRKVGNFLNINGKILFCCSSLSNKEGIERELERNGYDFRIISSKKLFFEELFVYLAERKSKEIKEI